MEQGYKQKFYENYSHNVLPQMMDFEATRKKCCSLFYMLSAFAGLLFTLLCLIVIKIIFFPKGLNGGDPTYLLFILVFLVFALAIVFYKIDRINKNFKTRIKNEFIPLLLTCFENLYWNSVPTNATQLQNSNLFGEFNQIETDDTFLGIYDHIKFGIQELELNYERETKNGTSNTSVFKGIVICIDSNKEIKSNVLIYPKYHNLSVKNRSNSVNQFLLLTIFLILFLLLYFIIPGFFIIISLFLPFILIIFLAGLVTVISEYLKQKKLENIKLEDTGFDKRFTVQAQDQVEARYLVTPAFMERLKNLQTAFGTKNLKCSFFDNNIMFTFSTKKDLFEIGDLFTPMTSSKYINKFYEEITSIYEMIDHFKLNERTGL